MLRLALICATAGPILAFSTGFADRYALPKLLILALGTALAWLALAIKARKGGIPLHRTSMDLPMGALLGVIVLSAAFSQDPLLSFFGQYRGRFNSVLTCVLCAALFQAVARSEDEAGLERMLDSCLLAGALAGLYAVLQWMGAEPFSGVVEKTMDERSYSTMGNPVFLGSVLLMLLPLALQRGGWKGPLSTALMGAGLVSTLSRGAWLSALAGCGFYLTMRFKGRIRPAHVLAALLLAAGGITAGTLLRRTAVADSSRVELWRCAGGIAMKNPWLGIGPETFQMSLRRERSERYVRLMGPTNVEGYAHNDFLEAFCTLGVFGLLAYLWLLWGAFRTFQPQSDLHAALAGSLLGLFIQIKLNPAPAAAYALAAAFAGIMAGRKDSKKGAWPALPALAVCWGALLIVTWMAAADRKQKLGLREEAVSMAPWEMHYRFSYVDFIFNRAKDRLPRAFEVSEEAVRLHPLSVDALQMKGLCLARLDRLAEARQALEQAQALDPYFLPLLDQRIVLAKKVSDAGAVSALEAQRDALKTRLGMLPAGPSPGQ